MSFLEELGQELENTINNNKNNTKDLDVSNDKITKDEIDLANKLDAIVEYTLDRFEGNFAICENRQTAEFTNISKDELPDELKEGDIFKEINGKYFIDKSKTEEISKRIENKMNNLWQ